MRIKSIRISNFFQHESLSLQLHPGATAVLAPNGSGKSNLIRAVYAGLAGEVLGGGDLESALRWGAFKGSVELDFEHMGEPGTVTRSLKGVPTPEGRARDVKCKHLLKCGEAELTRKTEVNEWLSNAIGVEVKALRELAFPRQGQLDRLFTCEHSERASILAEMLGLKSADKIRAALSDVKSRMWSIPADAAGVNALRGVLAEVEESHRIASAQLGAVSAELAGLVEFLPALKAAVALKTTEERDEECAFRSVETMRIKKRMGELRELLSKHGEAPEQITSAERAAAIEAKNAEVAEVELRGLKEDLMPLVRSKPRRPECDRAGLTLLETQWRDGRMALKRLAEELALLRLGQCPTCGHEFKDAAGQVAQLAGRHDELVELVDQRSDDLQHAKTALARYEREREAWLRRVADFRTRWVGTKATVDAGDGCDWRAVEAQGLACDKWFAADKAMSSHRTELAGLVERMKLRTAELEKARAEETVSAKDKADAEAMLARHAQLDRNRYDFERELASAKATLDAKREELARRESELARANTLSRAADLMDRTTQAFRPDGLPRLVIASSIGRLNAGIAQAMEGFGSPFGLSLDPDLDFVASFPEGDAPASVLSGGQMTMAAIAFRFAMLDMRAAGCGVMALDEPTAFVDGANKQALIELLTRMDGFLASAGVAALVPTHDEELAGACSRIIRLDE